MTHKMEEANKPLELDWEMVLGTNDEEPLEVVIDRKTTARPTGLNCKLMKPVQSDRQESDCSISEASPKSFFRTVFSSKMEEKETDGRAVHAFDEEISIIGHSNGQRVKSNGGTTQRRRKKFLATTRHQPFQCTNNLSRSADNHQKRQKERAASSDQFLKMQHSLSNNWTNKNWDWEAQSTNGAMHRKGKAFVLVDEDEIEDLETMGHEKELAECIKDEIEELETMGRERELAECMKDEIEDFETMGHEKELAECMKDEIEDLETMGHEKELAECMKDVKIFYPSSDDPESVEISYADIKCLDAEGFLTSPVINFYIRYLRLQASSTKRISDFQFFNTFFYEKLKQAVSYEGRDKKANFVKFRRWWKDVSLFQKSYILIPIHEDLHWSLIIICIPYKESGSGPILLHLDSLGIHHSKSIFENIKSYLTAEWNYLCMKGAPLDLPIPERIWENLPRRIYERRVEVPQQKNDYDCGPFMLFFMDRFVHNAPERLERKDLDMFSKRWFRPQEASGLRIKIRKLLLDLFQNASEVNRSWKSSSSDCTRI